MSSRVETRLPINVECYGCRGRPIADLVPFVGRPMGRVRVGDLPSLQAQLLLEELHAAQIPAALTDSVEYHAWPDRALSGGVCTVWVEDGCNPEDVRRILREFFQKHPGRGSDETCYKCGYALHGHEGEGRCPECGVLFRTAPVDVECPHCGEAVPDSFAACWSCGADFDAKPSTPD